MHFHSKPITDILERLRGVGVFYFLFCGLMWAAEPLFSLSTLLVGSTIVVLLASIISESIAWYFSKRPLIRLEPIGSIVRYASLARAAGVGMILGTSYYLYGVDGRRLVATAVVLCFCLGTIMVLRPNRKLMVACLLAQLLPSITGALASEGSLGWPMGLALSIGLFALVRHGQIENASYWRILHESRMNVLSQRKARAMAEEHSLLLFEQARRNAVISERNRIAGQWHDSLLAGLAAAALQIESAKRRLISTQEADALNMALATLRHCRQEARSAITDLLSITGDSVDLQKMLQAELTATARLRNLRLEIVCLGEPLPEQSANRAREILHIAQEALLNAARHGKAEYVRVEVNTFEQRIHLSLEDNGVGFDPAQVPNGHFGLQIMQQRADRINAVLKIESVPNKGTKISLDLPISERSSMNPVRILLVEDQFLSRLAFKTLLADTPHLQVIGEATTGSQALTEFETLAPDLIILDLRLPDGPGLDVLKKIIAQEPSAKVLIMSNLDGTEHIASCLAAGALGYLGKDSTPQEIFDAIDSASRGLQFLSASISRAYEDRNQFDQLSARELDVLELLVNGLSNRSIGDQLGIAEKTVRAHMSSIFSKLQARDRTHAAVLAIQRGFVQTPTGN